jgi:hypothetical protein
MSTKAHLIEGRDPHQRGIPAVYADFLRHYNGWRISHLRWTEQGIPYSWHWEFSWPEKFNKEVHETFNALKERHARFLAARREETVLSVVKKLPDVEVDPKAELGGAESQTAPRPRLRHP